MRPYAIEQGSKLLRHLLFCLNRAACQRDPGAIHDLRVAIRRFQQFLRVFRPFLPRVKARKIRPQLREIMKLSGEVRNRDVAAALLREAGELNESPLIRKLARQRKEAQDELFQMIERLNRRGVARKWPSKLRL